MNVTNHIHLFGAVVVEISGLAELDAVDSLSSFIPVSFDDADDVVNAVCVGQLRFETVSDSRSERFLADGDSCAVCANLSTFDND